MLAAALIEAVFDPKTNAAGHSIARVDVDSLVTPDSDFPDFTLYVGDDFPERPESSGEPPGRSVGRWIALALAVSFMGIVVFLAAVGATTVIRWLS